MKAFRICALVCAAAVLGVVSVALARGPGGGWGCGSAYVRMYNPDTEVTFSGEISKIEEVQKPQGMSPGIHIMVTGEDPCTMSPIHLGPAWYLSNQETQLKVGDKVEIVGSKVEIDGSPAIIAREVRRGDEVLVLRDKSGVPYWAGWRRMGR